MVVVNLCISVSEFYQKPKLTRTKYWPRCISITCQGEALQYAEDAFSNEEILDDLCDSMEAAGNPLYLLRNPTWKWTLGNISLMIRSWFCFCERLWTGYVSLSVLLHVCITTMHAIARPVIGEIFGHNRLRSWCLQVQPVTCSHPLVFLY